MGEVEQKPPPEDLNPWGVVVDSPPEGEGETQVERGPCRGICGICPLHEDPDPWGVADSPREGEGGAHIERIPVGYVWGKL